MHVWHCVQVTFSSGLLSPVPGLWIFGVCNVESGTCHWRQCSSGILAGLKRNWKLQLWFRQFGAQQNRKILYQGYHQPLRVVLPFLPKQCIKKIKMTWPTIDVLICVAICWHMLTMVCSGHWKLPTSRKLLSGPMAALSSSEQWKKSSCFGHTGNHTTQLYGDCNEPL